MMSKEYRLAVIREDIDGDEVKPKALIHAIKRNAETSACGRVEHLDLYYLQNNIPNYRYSVTCEHCLKALEAERQRRGREGRMRLLAKTNQRKEAA